MDYTSRPPGQYTQTSFSVRIVNKKHNKNTFSACDYDCFRANLIFNCKICFIKGTNTIEIKPMFGFSFVI